MPWTSQHLRWLANTGVVLQTADGHDIPVWEFRCCHDDAVISAWARHFRNHYCLDTEIDYLRQGIGQSRADYLNTIKFPDSRTAPGPSIRAGDFGEVLVADYLELVLGYWVPRTRYADKAIRNESTKGCDVIGFRLLGNGEDSLEDTLAMFESKTQFTGRHPEPRLQHAVDGSAKDQVRKAESLNAMKQHLFDKQRLDEATRVERFQNTEDRPYREVCGAVALFSSPLFDETLAMQTTAQRHPSPASLVLLVINGDAMMNLIHELYRRAADEA